jgi:HlyD family secretion protein
MERRVFTKKSVVGSTVIAGGLIFAAGAFVLWPAYTNPESRLYSSIVGFLKVQRFLGLPMEGEAGHPVLHDFASPVLGEGAMQCDFYNVPVVPTARIKVLMVEEGDKVKQGQVLAELDETQAIIDVNSAELAVSSAKAQLQRAEAGSVNSMQAERPEHDKVDLAGLEKILSYAQGKVAMYKKMEQDGSSSRLELINAETELANAELNYEQAKVSAGMSNQGQPQSRVIASNAVDDAQNLLLQKQEALKYFKVTAPADGIIDRVLVRDGEFNQDTGNTGFIIASGMWFEANLDQRSIADLQEGMDATVNLEAYTERSFIAKVERIIPIVTFNAGGPETKTPVRPLGTGTPEWPATFKIRLQLEDAGVKLAPGMTGFTRIAKQRRALALSRRAVLSLRAGKGVVRVMDDSNHLVSTSVSLGESDDQFVEITGGLDVSNWVLMNNPGFLRDNDRIHVTRLTASQQASKYRELTASQRDAVQAQLKEIEAKTQQAQKDEELTASQRNALQAQVKDLQAKAELTQKNGEIAASQRDALQGQLKELQAKAERAQKNGEAVASQRDALQAQLQELQAKVEQAQKNGEIAASQRDALQGQLKEVEAKAQQLAQKNGELVAGQRDALQAQLKDLRAKAEQAQKNGEIAASQRDVLQTQLQELQAKAEQAQKNGELAASQRDALQAQLKELQAKAGQAQKNGELAASQRDALQAQLKELQAKAEQAQKNGELAASQRDALQTQLKELQAKAEQAQKNGQLVASQRDALQAQLKDFQAKAQQTQRNGELDLVQANTRTGPSGDTEQRPVVWDPTPKTEVATQDEHASNLPRSRPVTASRESKKGRHAIKHRTVAKREREHRPLRAIDHWLRRHLPLAED